MSLNLILTGATSEVERLAPDLRRLRSVVDVVTPDVLVSRLRQNIDVLSLADAIVYDLQTNMSVDFDAIEFAMSLANAIYDLPNYVHMADGRKWNRVPFILGQQDMPVPPRRARSHAQEDLLYTKPSPSVSSWDVHPIEAFFSNIVEEVTRYRRRLLDEYSNLGFIVSHSNGRYRVGPALKPRKQLEGSLYYGPGDTSGERHYWTIDRELYGIQLEIEQFEHLLNSANVTERHFQSFFEKHPHFMSMLTEGCQPFAHPYLRAYDGVPIVPDFVLKPIVGVARDSRWKVLDLKMPEPKLIVGKGKNSRLSHEVLDAIRQLQRYGNYFLNPAHAQEIREVLGRSLRYPKLAVLIGRMPSSEYVEVLEREQSEIDVEIVTYDEVLESQREVYRVEEAARRWDKS